MGPLTEPVRKDPLTEPKSGRGPPRNPVRKDPLTDFSGGRSLAGRVGSVWC